MLSKLMYKYAPHFDDLQQMFCLHKAYSRFLVVGINSPTLLIGKVGLSLQGELFLMLLSSAGTHFLRIKVPYTRTQNILLTTQPLHSHKM